MEYAGWFALGVFTAWVSYMAADGVLGKWRRRRMTRWLRRGRESLRYR